MSDKDDYKQIPQIINDNNISNLCVVEGKNKKWNSFHDFLKDEKNFNNTKLHSFNNFSPNPTLEQVSEGLDFFRKHNCNGILAIGGGSALDVAKAIVYFNNENTPLSNIDNKHDIANILLFAIPTTAGTGSEATDFAVIYNQGKKYSIYHEGLLPDYVLLQTEFLYTLPEYQKKCSLLDALCQGIESYWSISSNEESRKFAELGIKKIWNNKEEFLKNNEFALKEVLEGANLCGRAIQITKTTAPHAMSYKLTSLFFIPHGHAVALCLTNVWELMEKVVDENKNNLEQLFFNLANFLNQKTPEDAIYEFKKLLIHWEIKSPRKPNEEEFNILCNSVDSQRLSNHPIKLTQNQINNLYKKIWNNDL